MNDDCGAFNDDLTLDLVPLVRVDDGIILDFILGVDVDDDSVTLDDDGLVLCLAVDDGFILDLGVDDGKTDDE